MDNNFPPPQANGPTPSSPATNSSGAGPIIGTIIILAVIILGGFYFWMQRQDKVATDAATEQTLQNIQTQSSSSDSASINTDLNSTDVNSIDSDLNGS